MKKRMKNIQTFEQKSSELNISDISESVSKEDRFLMMDRIL